MSKYSFKHQSSIALLLMALFCQLNLSVLAVEREVSLAGICIGDIPRTVRSVLGDPISEKVADGKCIFQYADCTVFIEQGLVSEVHSNRKASAGGTTLSCEESKEATIERLVAARLSVIVSSDPSPSVFVDFKTGERLIIHFAGNTTIGFELVDNPSL